LLYLPQIGRIWRKLAPRTDVVQIMGTHVSMMREPYVFAMARELRPRILDFFRNQGGGETGPTSLNPFEANARGPIS
jgi:hypothetical protein